MVAVFDNGCNQTFTYQINGPSTVFLGPGDLHDPKYDYLQITSRLSELETSSTRNSAYTGLNLTKTFCPWVVEVFPSETMEADYITKNAIRSVIVSANVAIQDSSGASSSSSLGSDKSYLLD